MRLLLWVLLATVVMLLSSTDAASAKLLNSATAKINSDVPVRDLVAAYNPVDKRNLRGNELVADSEDEEGEERAFSVSSLVNRMEASLQKMQLTASHKIKKYKLLRLFVWMYKRGETPVSFRTKMMGHDNSLVGLYKIWYERVITASAKR